MTTWIATFANSQNEDDERSLEIEADSQEEAFQKLDTRQSDLKGYFFVSLGKKRGGVRPGAGRKPGTQGRYCGATKPVRVPVDMADRIPELITNLKQLNELLTSWEQEANTSTSPRYHRAKKLLSEIRELGF